MTSITATASVQTPIDVVGEQQLSFGNVFPGVNKTIAATDLTNAGRFDVNGQASSPVTISFTLPATLGSAGNTMPIVSYTGVHAQNNAQTGGTAFSPAAGVSPSLNASGALWGWVGAQVQPATNQAAGVYTGSGTKSVVYYATGVWRRADGAPAEDADSSAGAVTRRRMQLMKREAWVVVGAMLLGVPLLAQGKPLTVTGVRGVMFGAVLPGMPRVVLRTDPANSGQFDIKGPKGGPVLLSFVLPLSMTGPGGALMPIVFGASDAGYSPTQSIGSQVGFDPKQPTTVTFPNNGSASVFVGATANPVTNQRAGAYTGTITLTVTVLP